MTLRCRVRSLYRGMATPLSLYASLPVMHSLSVVFQRRFAP
jgi:hypothetical protein